MGERIQLWAVTAASASLGALLSLCLLVQSLLLTLSILVYQAHLSKHSCSSLRTVIVFYPFH